MRRRKWYSRPRWSVAMLRMAVTIVILDLEIFIILLFSLKAR
jgi:hypothetical protein